MTDAIMWRVLIRLSVDVLIVCYASRVPHGILHPHFNKQIYPICEMPNLE